LNRNQFTILYALFKNNFKTQRELSKISSLSLGSVNQILKYLEDKKFITDQTLTELGLIELEKYKVDNAIIMAAGLSSRFVPLSFEQPKGLLEVKGERLIERQIRQLKEAGINEIVVVVGYMKEKFFYLEEKYDVKIVVNIDYFKRNNNSSIYVAQDFLKNTYICSSDNYFCENVFEPYVYESYYASVFNKGFTNEYCIKTNSKGKITNAIVGGENEWIMLGHAYITNEFSRKFRDILLDEYHEFGVDKMYWEDLYLKHITNLDMYINKYEDGIIYEFDSLDDLREFDPKYINNTDSKILKNICRIMECNEADIQKIVPIKKGLTNTSFLFYYKGKKYVYRHPGIGTNEIINRESEALSQKIALQLGIDKTLVYIDDSDGWKISHYIDNCIDFNYRDLDHVKRGITLIKTFHDAKVKSEWDFDLYNEAGKLIMLTNKSNTPLFEDYEVLMKDIEDLYQYTERDNIEKILCHNDCYGPNFLINSDEMHLIDWEYSGNADPACDLGSFIIGSDYSIDEVKDILLIYFGRDLTREEERHYLAYVAISAYYWFVWALYKESTGEIIGNDLYKWYKYAKDYSKNALTLYETIKVS
jgi:CTP:phosphocholine cytidylyltransferase-like protein/thiamine kinase-like enzyme